VSAPSTIIDVVLLFVGVEVDTRRTWLAGGAVSQAGFDGGLDSRVLSLGRGRLQADAPSEEVSARAA
jgi:hypothetical protein